MKQFRGVGSRILAAVMVVFTLFAAISSAMITDAGYTGMIGASADAEINVGGALGQTYTANGYERLSEAKLKLYLLAGQSGTLTVSVYQNLQDAGNPTSGVTRYTQTVAFSNDSDTEQPKEVSVPLADANICVAPGETFSVTATLSSDNTTQFRYYGNGSTGGLKKPSGEEAWNTVGTMIDVDATHITAADLNDITSLAVTPEKVIADKADSGMTLQTTLEPAYKRNAAYTSDNTGIVSVDANGALSFGATGTANVTVTAEGTAAEVVVPVTVLSASLNQAEGSGYDDGRKGYLYTGAAITPEVSVDCGGALTADDYDVTYENNTEVGTATATVTGRGVYEGYEHQLSYEIVPTAITEDASEGEPTSDTNDEITEQGIGDDGEDPLTMAPFAVERAGETDISDYVEVELVDRDGDDDGIYYYTGEEIRPTVKFISLETGTQLNDFSDNCTIDYDSPNNINVGEVTVTITGKPENGYIGTITQTFYIDACSISNPNVKVEVIRPEGGYVYTGEAITPEVKVSFGTKELTVDKDYTVSYSRNDRIGSAGVTIFGQGNFTGIKSESFNIVGDLEEEAVLLIGGKEGTSANNFETDYAVDYTGGEQKPSVKVTMNGKRLTLNKHYVLTYEKNTDAGNGTAKVIITGKGDYEGKQITGTFTINPVALNGTLSVPSERTYTGQKIELKPDEYSFLTDGGKTLTPDKDYELSYENNTNAGEATVIATGKGNYQGKVTSSFTISPCDIGTDPHITISDVGDQKYTGKAIEPEVTVSYDGQPLDSSQYTVEYTDNKNVGTDTATVTVTGKAPNLTGTKSTRFSILKKTLTEEGIRITVGGKECTFDETENQWNSDFHVTYNGSVQKPKIEIYNGDVLLTTSDYDITYATNTDVNPTAAHDGYIYVRGKGGYEETEITISFEIDPKNINSSDIKIEQTGVKDVHDEHGDLIGRLPELAVVDGAMSDDNPKRTLVQGTSYNVIATGDWTTSGAGKQGKIEGIGNYTGTKEFTYAIGENLQALDDTNTPRLTYSLQNPYKADDTYKKMEGVTNAAYLVYYLGDKERPKSVLTYRKKDGTVKDLVEGTDYEVTYVPSQKYDARSTVKITYTGKGEFYGSFSETYYIQPAQIDEIDKFEVAAGDTNYPYDGKNKGILVGVTYKPGGSAGGPVITLKQGTDYTVTPAFIGPNAGEYKVKLSGTGNYQGTRELTYTIGQGNISDTGYTIENIPNQVYTGQPIEPKITLKSPEGTKLVQDVDYTVSYASNTAIGTATINIVGKGNYTGTRNASFQIVPRDINNATFMPIADQTYAKTALTPPLAVSFNGEPLVQGTDYELAYSDNIYPGQATVTVTGKNNYSSSTSRTFRIVGDLSDTSLFKVTIPKTEYMLSKNGTLLFTTEGVKVEYLTATGAYAELAPDNYDIQQVNCQSPGDGQLVFAGKNFAKGSQSVPIKVVGNLDDVTVTGILDSYVYTGQPITPVPVVKYGSTTLAEGTDYEVSYQNNTNAGPATLTITAKADKFGSTSKIIPFKIQYDLTGAEVTGVEPQYDYTGKQIKPTPIVTCAGKQLSAGTDYTVKYGENTSAGNGNGYVTIVPKEGAYAIGEKTVTFSITGISLDETTVTVGGDSGNNYHTVYTGNPIKPQIVVSYSGMNLKEGQDYTVTLGNNLNAGIGTATVTIAGTGNYYGAVNRTFSIDKAGLDKVKFVVPDAGYAGGRPVTPSMTATYNGMTLVPGKDYEYEVFNNTSVTDNAYIVFNAADPGNYTGSITKYFKITKTNIAGGMVQIGESSAEYTGEAMEPVITVTCPLGDGTLYTLQEGTDYKIHYKGATEIVDAGVYSIEVNANEIPGNSFYGTLTTNFTVKPKPVTKDDIEIEVKDADYTGSKVTPEVTVRDMTRGVVLEEGKDYTLACKNNTTAASRDDSFAPPTVTVTGKGNYGASTKLTFNIGDSLTPDNAEVRIATTQQKFTYDGKAHVPEYAVILVQPDGTEVRLKKDRDYKETAPEDCTNVGTKTITIQGTGGFYGTLTANYEIVPKKAVRMRVLLDLPQDEEGNYIITFTGKEITPKAHVYDDEISSTREVRKEDYVLSFENNRNAGTKDNPAYAVVTLQGNYEIGNDAISVPFIIQGMDISQAFELVLPNGDTCEYTGAPVRPKVEVIMNNGVDPIITLVEGVDYDLEYSQNQNAGTAYVTARAKGNFSGEVSQAFTICASLKKADVTIEDQFYTGEKITPIVEVKCGGNTLVEGVDYKLEVYSDDNYTDSGYVVLTPLNHYYSEERTEYFRISFDIGLLKLSGFANEYTYTGYPIKPEFEIKTPDGNSVPYDANQVIYKDARGKADCVNIGKVKVQIPFTVGGKDFALDAEFEIIPKNINACTVHNLVNNTYTGKPLKSPVYIVYNGKELKIGKEYTTAYSNNTNPGTADVDVKGVGNFTGTAQLHFRILSPGVVGLKSEALSTNSVRISWLRSGNATGYQIYSADNKVLYGTTTSTNFVISGLRPQTEYVFRVRSFVKQGNNITYGAFQNVTAYTQVSAVSSAGVVSNEKNTAVLTWPRDSSIGGYEIYRSTTRNGTYRKVAVMPSTANSYKDRNVRSGATYYYRMRAYKKLGSGYVYGAYGDPIAVTVK